MKLKFSVRTLLLATGVMALYLGMVVWTQLQARKFAGELNKNTGHVAKRLLTDAGLDGKQDFCLSLESGDRAKLTIPSIAETMMMRHKCYVEFRSTGNDRSYDNHVEYRVGLFQAQLISSRQTETSAR